MTQFIDQVQIEVRSGDGGNGMVAWRREKYEPLGGPAGGNGGRGGHVILEATTSANTLLEFKFKSRFLAASGDRGHSKGAHGRQGKDLVIKVPVGTLVIDNEDDHVIADLVVEGQKVLVAEGGKGGRGNAMLATPTRRAPHFCEPGQPGIERKLTLELKLLADVGLVGLPNAGKSTLLSVVSRARPRIADYPFSTIEPKLGVMQMPSGNSLVMADIPGLIEGASTGVGLGHDFLRHLERTRLLVHLVDINGNQIENDIDTILNELKLYNERLRNLPRILVLNKSDTVDDETATLVKEQVEEHIRKRYSEQTSVFVISAAAKKGLTPLLNLIDETVSKLKELEGPGPERERILTDEKASTRLDGGYTVSRKKNVFYIEGDRVERLVAVTNLREPESLGHLWHVLRVMGVIEELLKAGAVQGSEVVINGVAFSLGDEIF